jgi:molecular chaperone HtpG
MEKMILIFLFLAMGAFSKEQQRYKMGVDEQLLSNVTHKVLKRKHGFISELISNAIDANKKYCIETKNMEADFGKNIVIHLDDESKTLSIEDNGIGLSDTEIKRFIGNFGASGSREMNNGELIGQFGMGLYSVFIAADSVEILSKRYDEDKAYKFSFDSGSVEYSLEESERESHGTTVTLKLRDNFAKEISEKHIEEWISENLLCDGSNTHFKIQMWRREEATDPETGEKKYEKKLVDLTLVPWTDSKDPEEMKKIYTKRFKGVQTLIDVRRLKFTIKQEHGNGEELDTTFEALVFMPEIYDMRIFGMESKGKLEVFVGGSKVHDKNLLKVPELLSQMYFVIKSREAALASTREEFLDSPNTVKRMFLALQRKIIEVFEELLSGDKSEKVISGYETCVKSAYIESIREKNDGISQKLASILPFDTLNGKITLRRMTDSLSEGDDIYYTTAPFYLVKSGKEMVHPLFDGINVPFFFLNGISDEQIVGALKEYKGRKVVNIATKSFDTKNVEGDYSEFISFSKKALDDMVGEVVVSKRLVTCPFSVRVSENSMSNTFKSVLGENFIKSSPFRSVLESKPTLEFNSDSEEVK